MKKVKPAQMDPSSAVYQPQSSLQGRGVVPWKVDKTIKRDNVRYPGPGDYVNEQGRTVKSISSCFASTSDRFGKAKKIREEKRPGPGAY